MQFLGDQRPNMSIVYSELKEAQSLEFESHRRDVFQNLSTTFKENDHDSLSLTHVNPR